MSGPSRFAISVDFVAALINGDESAERALYLMRESRCQVYYTWRLLVSAVIEAVSRRPRLDDREQHLVRVAVDQIALSCLPMPQGPPWTASVDPLAEILTKIHDKIDYVVCGNDSELVKGPVLVGGQIAVGKYISSDLCIAFMTGGELPRVSGD